VSTDRPDILLLSLGSTLGWRIGDERFIARLRHSGVTVAPVSVRMGATGRLRRAYPVTDLVEMVAARRALAAALDRHSPRALVISTSTAAMLADARGLPYAVRLDAPACMNRPGWENAVLHALERRALARARLVLPWSRAGRDALPAGAAPAVVVPSPLLPSGEGPSKRERTAVAYTPDVKAKGLDVACGAWAAANIEGARLDVFGVEREPALAYLNRTGTPVPGSVRFRGKTSPEEFRAALRRGLVYVAGARWEDYGQAPLEALADGALLATVSSGGPFEALALARQLAPELVAEGVAVDPLASALRAAFELPEERIESYRARASELLARFRPEAIDRTIRAEVLPALLA
jgi:glycosyltransferase involved in cell wall biosynthesis